MATTLNSSEYLDRLRKSQLVEETVLTEFLRKSQTAAGDSPDALANELTQAGLLTPFQAQLILQGKYRNFTIGGKYKLLGLLGQGGMGAVYLCEHVRLQTLVALKFLPKDRVNDPMARERFIREARAAASLNHPNIVRTQDIDEDRGAPFLVMEYADGTNLQQIVSQFGPLDPVRAANLIFQASIGLQEAANRGWVHRDIKPANLMLLRDGTLKILDMGLARLFQGEQKKSSGVTEKYDEKAVLGTADYIAPEQSMNSSGVDIRADIYSLGGTLYFLLTGRPPFGDATVAQKLIWHSMRDPEPVEKFRSDVPPLLLEVLLRMMAKDPAKRYQQPNEVAIALSALASQPVPVPPAEWMPRNSPALAKYGIVVGLSSTRSTPATPIPSTVISGLRSTSGVWSSASHTITPPPTLTPGLPTSGTLSPKTRQSNITWLVGIVCIALLLGGGFVYFVMKPPTPPPPVVEPNQPSAMRLISEVTKSGRFPILVAETKGRPNTIQGGLIEADKPGDRIVVIFEELHETLEIDGSKHGRDVEIIGFAQIRGKPLWQPPDGHNNEMPLLRIKNVERLRLSNFTIDGGGIVDNLVEIVGRCPGLKLDNLQLKGFRNNGLVLRAAHGEPDEPAILDQVRIQARRERANSAIIADAIDKPLMHWDFTELMIEGPFQVGLHLAGPTSYVKLTRSRFWRCQDAVNFVKHEPPHDLRLSIENCTFDEVENAIHLGAIPPIKESNRIVMARNLFWRVQRMVWIEGKPGRDRLAALFPNAESNVYDRNAMQAEGGYEFGGRRTDIDDLPTNPEEANFLRYPKGSPLATFANGSKPVGVPPE